MSVDGADPRVVREVLRDVLSELLPELVADARARPRRPVAAPMFPPPPVAAVAPTVDVAGGRAAARGRGGLDHERRGARRLRAPPRGAL